MSGYTLVYPCKITDKCYHELQLDGVRIPTLGEQVWIPNGEPWHPIYVWMFTRSIYEGRGEVREDFVNRHFGVDFREVFGPSLAERSEGGKYYSVTAVRWSAPPSTPEFPDLHRHQHAWVHVGHTDQLGYPNSKSYFCLDEGWAITLESVGQALVDFAWWATKGKVW